ncbi:MAG: DUF5694 domain-containing protein [Bacteroidetes bacterium]|jgi:hypothetical protein|nr:DUF5694 domain-containing protein [Bacteroidota bacterium]MDF1865510.1 DUF5694 domain-containing protein [Saprospiraceae bacterium]
MKNITLKSIILLLISLLTTSIFAQTQQKEVLIIGTMHGVPKIVKNSYRPLLKKAKNYKPEAIFVEMSRAEDTLSLQKGQPWLISFADSIRQNTRFDENKISELQGKNLNELISEEFRLLSTYYYTNLDVANARYYKYLSKYGFEGRKKPSRAENQDLSFPLAAEMRLKIVHAMDFQQDRNEYSKTARQCYIESSKDQESKAINKTLKRNTIREYLSAIVGRLAYHNNAPKTIKVYHDINSMDFRKTDCEPCKKSQSYWNKRNQMMVRNIGNEIQKIDKIKNIVIVGAGHVYGMKAFFEKEYPDIKVKLLRD